MHHGEAKVADLGLTVSAQEDVVRLDVAVHDAGAVRAPQGSRQRAHHAHDIRPMLTRRRWLQALLGNAFGQGVPAGYQLHGDPMHARVFADGIHRHNVLVRQTATSESLILKAPQRGVGQRQVRVQQLQRYLTPRQPLLGLPHLPHPPAPQFALEHKSANLGARSGSHHQQSRRAAQDQVVLYQPLQLGAHGRTIFVQKTGQRRRLTGARLRQVLMERRFRLGTRLLRAGGDGLQLFHAA